jgi:SAM-dependent methyltransferase
MHVPVRRRDAWMRLPTSSRLLAAERTRLSAMLDDLFGYYLFQVGGWGRHIFQPEASRIRNCHLMDLPGGGASVVADPGAWPVTADSVDVVVLPHTLELTANPHAVLREAERALVGEGYLLVLGFNPWSPWRLRVPWSGRLVSEGKLRDWLALLDFEVVRSETHAWSIAFGSERLDAWHERLRAGGWPLPSGAYLLLAKKRVVGMTPIRPSWKEDPARGAVPA